MKSDPKLPRLGGEWKVVIALAVLMVLLEAGSRWREVQLSKDVAHLKELPAIADRLRQAGGRKVLLVGNSLARRGVAIPEFREALGAEAMEAFVPDGSGITEWSWGLRRYFLKSGQAPDTVVVFTARNHLLDGSPGPEKLGAYFVADGDLRRAMSDAKDPEWSARLVMGRLSSLFALRDRVRPLVGYNWLPGFEAAWAKIAAGGVSEQARPAATQQPGSVESLKRLVDSAQAAGARVVVVAVPMPKPYELPTEVTALLRETGVPVVDLSQVPTIEARHFPDDYHLGEEGARLFTVAMIAAWPR